MAQKNEAPGIREDASVTECEEIIPITDSLTVLCDSVEEEKVRKHTHS
jgi:hypothetical protein